MSCKLAIYDYETDYANNLMSYIKRKMKWISQVRVFTNFNSLQDYLNQNQINILLLSESISAQEVFHENIKNICLLSEGTCIREHSEYPFVYKFQSAEKVMQDIFSYYPLEMQEKTEQTFSENKVKIISLFSIAGDTEQTVLSFSLAQQYAKIKKTLYINLDLFQAFPEMLGQNIEKSLSEFIYFLKQNHPNIIAKMNGIVTKVGGLDYIQGVTFGPDLYELSTQDMTKWINELKKSNEYEVVIFDVGCFFQATLELFRESNQLILLLGESDWEQAKYNNFKNQLVWAGFDDVLQKVKMIPISMEDQQKHQNFTIKDLYGEKGGELAAAYMEE